MEKSDDNEKKERSVIVRKDGVVSTVMVRIPPSSPWMSGYSIRMG